MWGRPRRRTRTAVEVLSESAVIRTAWSRALRRRSGERSLRMPEPLTAVVGVDRQGSSGEARPGFDLLVEFGQDEQFDCRGGRHDARGLVRDRRPGAKVERQECGFASELGDQRGGGGLGCSLALSCAYHWTSRRAWPRNLRMPLSLAACQRGDSIAPWRGAFRVGGSGRGDWLVATMVHYGRVRRQEVGDGGRGGGVDRWVVGAGALAGVAGLTVAASAVMAHFITRPRPLGHVPGIVGHADR